MNRTAQFFILITSLSLLAGCSTFDHDWDAAVNSRPADRVDITGRWQGTWSSDADGHSGGLRCLVTRVDKKVYHARFAATYGGIFHFNYEMDLTAERQVDWVKLEGEADLGSLAGGVYHYEGHADAEKFIATYRCSADHGQFNLKRPE